MSRFEIHVCMVSGQAAPNLLPLLDDEMRPQAVALLVTPPMRERAEYLKQVIMPRGIRVVIYALEKPDDFDGIQEVLLNILAENEGKRMALNATGGTKWMAMAAQEVFRSNNQPIFYVDVDTDQVLFLGEGKTPPHPLSQCIDIANYLAVYGYRIIHEEKPDLLPAWRELCQELVLNTVAWEMALGYLNYVASEAEEKNTLRVSLEKLGNQPVYLDTLIRECHKAGLIRGKGLDVIEFVDANARRFCNGGWLEAYASRLLGELRGEKVLQESPHLNITVQGGNSKNEVDVAFMARNRLHIIECKTKRMQGEQSGQAGAETVYKLDSLSELGGLGTKAMLVSYRKLRKADAQRAKDLRIKVVEGAQLITLKEQLRNWIKSR